VAITETISKIIPEAVALAIAEEIAHWLYLIDEAVIVILVLLDERRTTGFKVLKLFFLFK